MIYSSSSPLSHRFKSSRRCASFSTESSFAPMRSNSPKTVSIRRLPLSIMFSASTTVHPDFGLSGSTMRHRSKSFGSTLNRLASFATSFAARSTSRASFSAAATSFLTSSCRFDIPYTRPAHLCRQASHSGAVITSSPPSHRKTGARTAVLGTRSRVRAPFHHNITSGECAS